MYSRKLYKKAARKARTSGGFVHWLPKHAVMFYPRGKRLIVTFDAAKAPDDNSPVFAWAHALVRDTGSSHLAVMMTGPDDWYRCGDLRAYLEDLKAKAFFEGFEEVVFSGSRMGGYGALTFAALCPGARIVALSAFTSLDTAVVPFERRFRPIAEAEDWTGPYSDGAVGAASAKQIYVIADPYSKVDAAHIARLPGRRLIWLKTPHMKLLAERILNSLGALDDVLTGAWSGALGTAQFDAIMEQNKGSKPVAQVLIRSAIDAGHYELAEKALDAISEAQPKWEFPVLAARLQEAQKQRSLH